MRGKITRMLSVIYYSLIGLTFLMLINCGGGGGDGGAPATNTPNTTTYNISKFTSLTTGDTWSSTLAGSDTAGGAYTGSIQSIVDGPTIFEGRNVIQKRSLITLIRTGVGVIVSTISTSYFNTDRTLYKTVYPNGVTATPTSTFPLPTTVQVGNFAGQSLNYSNGNSETSTWQVVDAGNGNANISITTTTNSALSEIDTIRLLASGNMSAITMVVYNLPSNGVTTTLTGIVN